MSELDDLPSWAGRSTEEVQLPVGPPEETPITEGSAPAPPTLPDGSDSEIAAPTAADPAPPAPPAVPDGSVEDPNVTQVADTPPIETPAEPAVLAERADAAAAPTMTEPVETTRRRSRLRPLLLGLLGLGILAAAAAIGYAVASNDGDATEATGTTGTDTDAEADGETDPAAPAADADTADDAEGETATETGAEGTSGEDGTTEDGTETVTVDVDEDADAEGDADAETDGAASGDAAGDDGDAPLNDGDRQAVFRGGKVYLSGAVPSEEIGAAIVAKAEAVVGPGNVINEYTIDPSTTIEPGSSAPLYVEDVVLFEFNSVEVATPFLPILDLGTLLLRQNPQASVTVVTRTDAVGSEEVNLEVARRRAQAVINYWLGQGVNPDQIVADPRGEEGASEDDDAETAARQRRAEFIITGLLD